MSVSLPASEVMHYIQESVGPSGAVSIGDDDGLLQSFNLDDYQAAGQFYSVSAK